MRSLDEIRAALEACYAAIEGLCADLSEADWTAQSLCPDWVVRDVIQHVVSIEAVMAGWLPEDDRTPPPFGRAASFLEGTDDPAVLAQSVGAVLAERRRDLSELTPADLDRPSWMPVGPGSYGRFLEIRVFDFWVHVRDITIPLGRSTDDTGLAAELALAQVESSIGYIAGKKVGVPEGSSIAFQLTGPLVREIDVAVNGRAKQVEHLDNPTTTLTTDSTTFIMLACGRIDPQAQIDSGAVSWTGDGELGERAARNLRFTM
ncbi:maleylpyruvate isomerase N-terminal domain-containing protein [Mycolicibacterium sp. P1-5]|uniref:maleylpyruvate isomerase N-terminal domain-containing protein n=1 Tax=Mycolicibacterium sp. P1-5 TaxID=2024617 RepID=UPI0011EF4113|nr:maleylpyruvate isomerase N-terminal domain-containing protein [Mycolicibacterium sp. P1-5]KAA0100555.1 maleylpyruvate isomerase family mycothiol-dependent enzyme [Mycolicibacterium sp. P1-5]